MSDWPTFNYPLSPIYLNDKFSSGKQIDSGQSVIILSPNEHVVYKKPMMQVEDSRLRDLVLRQLLPGSPLIKRSFLSWTRISLSGNLYAR